MMYHRQHIIKWVLYGLLLWFMCTVQIALPLKWNSVHALPILPLAVVVSVFEGPKGGAVFGFIAGLVCDAFIPGSEAFFAVYLLLAGFLIGSVVNDYFKISFVTALIWAAAAHVLADLIYFLFFILIPGRAGAAALLNIALPEVLLSLPYLLLLYPLARGIHRRFAIKY